MNDNSQYIEPPLNLILLSKDWKIVGLSSNIQDTYPPAKGFINRSLLDIHTTAVQSKVVSTLNLIQPDNVKHPNTVVIEMFSRVFAITLTALNAGNDSDAAYYAASLNDITEASGAINNPETGATEYKKLPFYDNGKIHFLAANDIYAIIADGNYCTIYTQNNHYYLLASLKSILSKFPASPLLRVHKSAIVNLLHINNVLKSHQGKTIVQLNNPSIPPIQVSRRNLAKLKTAIKSISPKHILTIHH